MTTTGTPAKAEAAFRDFVWTAERLRLDQTIPRRILENAISHLHSRVLAEADLANRIDMAERAEKTLAAFGRLAPHHRAALGEADRLREKGHLSAAEIARQTGRAEAEAWAADPLLADLHAALVAEADQQRRTAEAAELAGRPEAARNFATALLARLRASGVTIALDAAGNITAGAADPITVEDAAALRQHKPHVVAAIKAETPQRVVVA